MKPIDHTIDACWYGQWIWTVSCNSPSWLDSKVEFKLSINAIHTFVIPDKTFNVSQAHKT